jgi:hypothetical protein
MIRTIVLTLSLIFCFALLARAQPTTQPGMDGPPRGGMRPGRGPMSAEDISRAIEFARTNMPHLSDSIEELSPDDPRRRRLTRYAFERYRMAQRLQRDHPNLYEAMLRRLRSQDEVFLILRKFQQAPEDQKSQFREQLEAKVREIVLGWVDERERRIEELRKQLEREEQQLQRDREEIDKLANRQLELFMGEMRDGPLTPPDIDEPPPPSTTPSERGRRSERRDHR